MKTTVLVLVAACLAGTACAAAERVDDALDFSAWYTGVSGGWLLPGCGNTLSRAGEVSFRVGRSFGDEVCAWELDAACAPTVGTHDGHEALTGLASRGLYHLNGFEEFDRLFGCERFDPFVSAGGALRFGARHAFADRSHRTALGPTVGLGAFYHLTDNLSLRFDMQAMLAVDSPCGLLCSAGLGLQWTFGGSGE